MVLIIIFLFSIYTLPLKTIFSQKAKISKSEKRALATMPSLEMNKDSIGQFPLKFESYFNDHFGFRSSLIYLHNYIKTKWLETSPVDDVMIGKNDWLYYTPRFVLEDLQGDLPFTPKQIEKWKNLFESRQKWLAASGIRYLLVIVPNKHSIYPENIKEKYLKKRGKTRTDQLTEYLRKYSNIDFLDLRGPLRKEKKNSLVYFPTDLHLNHEGAFIAYKEIIQKISTWFPNKKILPGISIDESIIHTTDGELAIMLGLPDCYPAYRHIVKVRAPCSVEEKLVLKSAPKGYAVTKTCETAELYGVVFMDSMGLRLMPFLSESFRRIHFLWRYFDFKVMKEIIEKEQPDIVIEEVLERLFIAPFDDSVFENLPKS